MDLTEFTLEQLSTRASEIHEEFKALQLSTSSSEEDIAKGEALADELTAIRNEQSAREVKAAETEKRLSDLSDAFTIPDDIAAEAPEEIVAEVDGVVEEIVEIVQEIAEEPIPVAASSNPARRVAIKTPAPKVQSRNRISITAAADVPNFAAGHQFSTIKDASEAVISRARSLPQRFVPNTRLRYSAVKFAMDYGDLVQGTDTDDLLLKRAGDEKRLPGGKLSLTADAWCAPSETLYDLCSTAVADGLLSMPEFQVTRGGIRYVPSPDFSAVYSDADSGFHISDTGQITDATGAVATEKPCLVVDCPAPVEERLEVDGVCISVDILQSVGFPELGEETIEKALVAHARRMNRNKLAAIQAAAGAPITSPDNGTLLFNMDYIEWHATNQRSIHSLPVDSSYEVVAPIWLLPLLRAEYGRRNAGTSPENVTDAQIRAWFSARNLSVQFVRDWQGQTVTPPATVDLLLYPSGSWTRGTQGVISLDTVYDSAMLAQNKYIGLFTEEASLYVQRCLNTQRLSIPLCVGGLTGAQIESCFGTANAVTP